MSVPRDESGFPVAEAERLGRIVVNGVKRIVGAGTSENVVAGQVDAYEKIQGKWYDQVGRDLVAVGFQEMGPYRNANSTAEPEKDAYYRFALSDDRRIVASWFMGAFKEPRPCVVLHSYRADDLACTTGSGLLDTGIPVPSVVPVRMLPPGAPVRGTVELHRRDMERSGSEFRQLADMDDVLATRRRYSVLIQQFREAKGVALCEPYLRAYYKEKYEVLGAPVLAAILDNKEWWNGEKSAREKEAEEARRRDDGRSGPYDITARFYQHVEPSDRGSWYEEPLEEALRKANAGVLTGGGSQLNAQGGIDFADIEIEAADRHEALDVVVAALEAAGAPQGSELRWGEDVVREFGTTQGLAIFLDGLSLPDHVYAELDFDDLVARLEAAAGPGSHRGFSQGPEETGLFFYGPDAEEMFRRVEPVLGSRPIGQNARVVIRYGKPSLNPRTIRMPRS